MTRETLDRKLKDLRDGVLILGSMVEQATLDAVDALKRQDVEKARQRRSRVAQGLNVPTAYVSPVRLLRPCWTDFLNGLWDS